MGNRALYNILSSLTHGLENFTLFGFSPTVVDPINPVPQKESLVIAKLGKITARSPIVCRHRSATNVQEGEHVYMPTLTCTAQTPCSLNRFFRRRDLANVTVEIETMHKPENAPDLGGNGARSL